MKKSVIVIVLTVSVAALAIWVMIGSFTDRPVKESTPKPPPTVEESVAIKPTAVEKLRGRDRGKNNGIRKNKRRRDNGEDKKVSRVRIKVEDTYTPEERKLADDLQEASDENGLAGVRKAVAAIMGQKNPELKVEAINALGFYGKDSLKDLMAFLKDSSEEVVDAATDRIALSLEELDDEDNAFRAEFISTLLSIGGLCSKDAVERFVGQLESMGSSDWKVAVQTLSSLINGEDVGDVVKTRAKEAYQFVTGEEYTTIEAAEKWYNDKVAEEESEKQDEPDDGESDDEESDDGDPDDDEPDDGDEAEESTSEAEDSDDESKIDGEDKTKPIES